MAACDCGGRVFSLVARVSAAVAIATAPCARAADFYQGKSLTLIVGYAPGGGVDTTARVIARHLVRFIPGQPGIVVQNMEGAAGVVAVNYLARRVAPDGLTLGIPGRSWFMEGVVKSPGVTFDPTTFTYIGSPGAVSSSVFVRSSTGVKTFADLASSSRTLIFGALGSTTPTAVVPALLAANGAPIKVVLGYGSTARILLALEQGEIDGFYTVDDSFARRQDLIANKVVLPILQSTARQPGIPLVRDVVPASEAALLALVMAADNIGLALIGPAGMPAERAEILRRAFRAMARDPDYQTDAEKIDQPVGAPIGGAQLATLINELAAIGSTDAVAAFKRLRAAR
jgi:tripartite-type tricarboxylate transporter receptor subunit TctC